MRGRHPQLVLLATLISLTCACDAAITNQSLATGWYINGNIGLAHYHQSNVSGHGGDTQNALTLNAGLGYNRLFKQNWLWNAEGAYQDYGHWKDAQQNSKRLFAFSALGGLGRQINPRVTTWLTLGLSAVRGPKFNVHPTFGIVGRYAYAGNLTVRGSILRTQDVMQGITTITVGLGYSW